jgi:hypothetical protein
MHFATGLAAGTSKARDVSAATAFRPSPRCPSAAPKTRGSLNAAVEENRNTGPSQKEASLPWIVPSHQAPALALKHWKPRLFSGFGLVLGSLAPDLEFILRLDGQCFVSHTLLGQLTFTVPMVLVLYVLSAELVVPWIARYLSSGPPLHVEALSSLRRPRGRGWLTVAFSGFVGGLTHLFLDGFTHGDQSGWAVARLSVLRVHVPLLGSPLYEVLQGALTIGLGAFALVLWSRMAREGERDPSRGARAPRASTRAKRELARWLAGCVAAGVTLALGFRPQTSFGVAVERGAYGALTFLAFGLVMGALADRLVRPATTRGVTFAPPLSSGGEASAP